MNRHKHIIPAFGTMNCQELNRKDVYCFIQNKLNSGLSARYVSDLIVLMKSIYKYAHREYNIKNEFDSIVMPKKVKREIRILSKTELEKLKSYINANPSSTGLALMISLLTGLRIGEICALKWDDLDLSNRVLSVKNTIQRIQCYNEKQKTKLIITEPKSESSIRVIPIPDCLAKSINMNKGQPGHYVLTDTNIPLEPRTLQYRFVKSLKNANLPSVHFHSLRHLFSTNAIATGFDIKTLSEILGHSSVEVTLNRYVHSSIERKRLCMNMMKWTT